MGDPWKRRAKPSPYPHALPAPSALAKQDLKKTVELAQKSFERFWHPGTGGNFSVRDHGDLCWVSPSGKHKGQLRWQDFLAVNFQRAELVQPCYSKPSDETALHCAVYRADPSARAVIHCHPPHAIALLQGPMKLAQNEMLKVFGLNTHDAEIDIPWLPNTQDMQGLGQSVTLDSKLKILMLGGHGLYAWGKSPDEAMYRIEALEFLCQLRLLNP